MKNKNICLLLLMMLPNLLWAQSDTTRLLRNKSIIALPVVFRFPETRWGAGVAGTATWNWGKESAEARPSQASIGLTFTQNKQVLAFLPFKVFFGENKYYLTADIGWYKYNFFYYGVGENRVAQERYDVKFPRVKMNATRKFGRNIYAGIGLNYEEYNITGRDPLGELFEGNITGSSYSRTSAIGPAFIYDSRDLVFYPRKGYYLESSLLQSSKVFGADRSFTQFTFDLAGYKGLGKKLVLAGNAYSVFSSGKNLPFSQMAQLGGGKKMRGIYQGFFRDQNAGLLQGELRLEIWKMIGAVGFANIGFLGDNEQLLRFQKPKYTYGGGLRIATKNHLNLRLDYGLSPYDKGNFYATVGEAF